MNANTVADSGHIPAPQGSDPIDTSVAHRMDEAQLDAARKEFQTLVAGDPRLLQEARMLAAQSAWKDSTGPPDHSHMLAAMTSMFHRWLAQHHGSMEGAADPAAQPTQPVLPSQPGLIPMSHLRHKSHVRQVHPVWTEQAFPIHATPLQPQLQAQAQIPSHIHRRVLAHPVSSLQSQQVHQRMAQSQPQSHAMCSPLPLPSTKSLTIPDRSFVASHSNFDRSLCPTLSDSQLTPAEIDLWLNRCADVVINVNDTRPAAQKLSVAAQIRHAGLAMEAPLAAAWWDLNRDKLLQLTDWNEFATKVRTFVSAHWRAEATSRFHAQKQGNRHFGEFVASLEASRAALGVSGFWGISDAAYKQHLVSNSHPMLQLRTLDAASLDLETCSPEVLISTMSALWAALANERIETPALPDHSAPFPAVPIPPASAIPISLSVQPPVPATELALSDEGLDENSDDSEFWHIDNREALELHTQPEGS